MSGYGVCFPHSTDDLGQAEVLYLQCAKSSHLPYRFWEGSSRDHNNMMCHTVSKIVSCVSTHPNYEERQVILIGYCSRRASWISSYNRYQYDINIIESHWLQSHTINVWYIYLPLKKHPNVNKYTTVPRMVWEYVLLNRRYLPWPQLLWLSQPEHFDWVMPSQTSFNCCWLWLWSWELHRVKKKGDICNFGEPI